MANCAFRIMCALVMGYAAFVPAGAACEDLLRLAVGAPNNWDSGVPTVGQEAGIFKKHGLRLELLYTNGGGETLQAVISGGVDIGIAAGTGAVAGAFAKGAPVRILLAGTTGAGDLYWYVPQSSPLKSFSELNGRTVAYSTNGASTHITLLALIKHFGVSARPVSTGAAAVTVTQAMSGQVDVGWASPPFGLKEIDAGQIRVIARATDSALVRGQTVRVLVTNTDTLTRRKDVVARFLDAYREAIDYMYSDNPQVIKDYAEFTGVPEATARRVRDEFFAKSVVNPDDISGLDALVKEAVNLKFIERPLTAQQLAELIQIPPRKK